MADFASVLQHIQTASQIAAVIEPALEQFSADHVAGTQTILQIAGAGVAAEVSDPTIQAEAQGAAALASSLVPLVFKLFSLFHRKKA